jgi:low affinity Fe/Cu permease
MLFIIWYLFLRRRHKRKVKKIIHISKISHSKHIGLTRYAKAEYKKKFKYKISKRSLKLFSKLLIFMLLGIGLIGIYILSSFIFKKFILDGVKLGLNKGGIVGLFSIGNMNNLLVLIGLVIGIIIIIFLIMKIRKEIKISKLLNPTKEFKKIFKKYNKKHKKLRNLNKKLIRKRNKIIKKEKKKAKPMMEKRKRFSKHAQNYKQKVQELRYLRKRVSVLDKYYGETRESIKLKQMVEKDIVNKP